MATLEPPLAPSTTYRVAFSCPGSETWIRVGAAASRATILVNGTIVGRNITPWTPTEVNATSVVRDHNELVIECADEKRTTEGFLPTIGIRWTGVDDVRILTSPTPLRLPARQRSAVDGTKFLVDGKPYRVRGVLHWGYYPELGNPWPDERQIRSEIDYIRSLGFNLIKFCLWIPPQRYYDICQEMGMFMWQEYPVWHAPLDAPEVLPEFDAFFRNDAPYENIILRTLTCENDHVAPNVGRLLIDRCRQIIPGAVILDNSGWLCNEHDGDFHDEHPYLNNMEWVHFGRRMAPRLSKPLMLGETMYITSPEHGPCDVALDVRRFQIETLARELPDAGYVHNVIRDVPGLNSGFYKLDGEPRYTAAQWAWHGDTIGPPREMPPLSGTIIGPRKGQWKCPNHWWFSSNIRIHDPAITEPIRELIRREAHFDLMSGRVLDNTHGTRVLVDLIAETMDKCVIHPLVIEFATQGQRRIVSAFRTDTDAGRRLMAALESRESDPPEIGALVGNSIVLDHWQMSVDGEAWIDVKCDTALVNEGRNIFEGWATFRTQFDYPGGEMTLRCETVGDYFECLIDGKSFAEAGPRDGTWDGTRDVPHDYPLSLAPGSHSIEFRVRDWRGGGGMIGPVYIARDLSERIF
ncbi:MAG: hypothetical protein H6818_02485 [Phycisphaerales bacterium]|nr:hypothetical protein [Phycisphaerales bacterium]MCB9863182.1 hypothetical protein [Phycisphaerales bacterium]